MRHVKKSDPGEVHEPAERRRIQTNVVPPESMSKNPPTHSEPSDAPSSAYNRLDVDGSVSERAGATGDHVADAASYADTIPFS